MIYKSIIKNILTASFLFISISINAQNDTLDSLPPLPELPDAKYAVYKYDASLQTDVLTYQYWDLWDFDNDGIKDCLSFTSNGGSHAYYHLKILLSTKKEWIVYPTFQVDMPFLNTEAITDEITQFSVYDFDNDGVDEIYLNVDNPFGTIPKKLRKEGLTSKRMLIEFENQQLIIKNFKTNK